MEKLDCYYPQYFDYKLQGVYNLEKISVFTQANGFSHYSLFISEDGENFNLVSKKSNNNFCDVKTGDIYHLDSCKANIIRILYEYYSEDYTVEKPKIEYVGKVISKSFDYKQNISVCDFNESKYNVKITEKDTIDELYGIVSRTVGEKYKTWFYFSILNFNEYDCFKIENSQ